MPEPALNFGDRVPGAVKLHGNQMADSFESEVANPGCLAHPFHPVVIILDRASIPLIAEYAVRGLGESVQGLQFHQIRNKFAPEGADMTGLARWMPEKQPAPTPAMSPVQEFVEVLKEVGLDLGGELPVMDGTQHRVPLIDGKPGSRDGAYRGNLDGHQAGF